MYKIRKRMEVSGAHRLELPYDSPCKRLHGHNWIVEVEIQGDHLNAEGMLLDFTIIKKVVNQLDHDYLNALLPFNPTAENIARWICEEIQKEVSADMFVSEVMIQESEGNTAWYTP